MDKLRLIPRAFRLILAAAAAWVAWKLLYLGGNESHLVEWYCDGQGCSTNDLRAPAPVAGGILAVAAGVLASRLLRGATAGLVLLLIAVPLGLGFQDSVTALGNDPGSVFGWVLGCRIAAVTGVVLTVWGTLRSLHNAGTGYRLFTGRKPALARLHRYQAIDQVRGTATAVFLDRTGARFEVPVEIHRALLDRQPVTVLYDPAVPADPQRLRIVSGWLTSSERVGALEELTVSLPVPEDHMVAVTEAGDGDQNLTATLERLARLRRNGDLTDAEYTAAKAKLLS